MIILIEIMKNNENNEIMAEVDNNYKCAMRKNE